MFFPIRFSNPLRASAVNVLGTQNLLELGRRLDVKKFLFASSCYVYGTHAKIPFNEGDKVEPNSLLGAAKFSAEQFCRVYSESYGFSAVISRIFTVYGPRSAKKQFLPSLIADILSRSKIELRDPNPTRDFIYVSDVVNAFSLLLDKVYKSGIYNVGSGRETRIKDIVSVLLDIHRKQTGKTVKVGYSGKKRVDEKETSRMLADIQRLKNLGWRAKVDLKSGLEKTYKWFKDGN